MVTCTWVMSSILVGSWFGPCLYDFSKWVIQLGKLSKCRREFLEGSQHYYYSVWKDIYFLQNLLTFKSKKAKFLKGKILPFGVWLHKFPFKDLGNSKIQWKFWKFIEVLFENLKKLWISLEELLPVSFQLFLIPILKAPELVIFTNIEGTHSFKRLKAHQGAK